MRLSLGLLSKAIAAALIFASTTAGAQNPITAAPSMSGMSQRQTEIMTKALSPANGALTKEMHTEFWSSVVDAHGKPSASDRAGIKSMIEEFLDVALIYQRETWASAMASAKAKKEIYTPGYAAARDKALKGSTKIPMNPAQLQSAIENGERVIKAAATGAVMNARGQSVYITEEAAAKVLGSLDGALTRARRLFNPEHAIRAPLRRYQHRDPL